MSLATVIRAEFAYPGVGVLAGDSLQYLSIATAHGVIMVFFMIMPALFGAFGNFLLPTQLGVHDVAFPRLNSAAFWFLPGGLVMLLQLVCVDRRYQRMNAFNIRELQATLKRSYFTDLLNVKDQREVLNGSMLGLRYKFNSNAASEYDTHLYHAFGPTVAPKLRGNALFTTQTSTSGDYFPDYFSQLVVLNPFRSSGNFSSIGSTDFIHQLTSTSSTRGTAKDLVAIVNNPALFFFSTHSNLTYRLNFMNFPNLAFRADYGLYNFTGNNTPNELLSQFDSERFTRSGIVEAGLSSGSESGAVLRYTRFTDPSIDYAYRSGNYFGRWDGFFTSSMLVSALEITRKVRKAP
jgi:hypothetical protein